MKQWHKIMIGFNLLLSVAYQAWAMPSEQLVHAINQQVFRVHVVHQDGRHGLGSAVVIQSQQVVTNCHVVTDANDVRVNTPQGSLPATAIQADWKHDLCILTVPGLSAQQARLGTSKQLGYAHSVFTAGFPETSTQVVNSFGQVQALYPMDDAMIIRASSGFNLGASGGGLFDETGALVGIITLKSKGHSAQYFFMPSEWVSALMEQPPQSLGGNFHKAFWAASNSQRPFFMQVVEPYTQHDWQQFNQLSQAWVNAEPYHAESWLALATAEFELQHFDLAQAHFAKVLQLREDCQVAKEYLMRLSALKVKSEKLSLHTSNDTVIR